MRRAKALRVLELSQRARDSNFNPRINCVNRVRSTWDPATGTSLPRIRANTWLWALATPAVTPRGISEPQGRIERARPVSPHYEVVA
jgi:hypothetical protein